jgi:hypothetical protein
MMRDARYKYIRAPRPELYHVARGGLQGSSRRLDRCDRLRGRCRPSHARSRRGGASPLAGLSRRSHRRRAGGGRAARRSQGRHPGAPSTRRCARRTRCGRRPGRARGRHGHPGRQPPEPPGPHDGGLGADPGR